MNNSVVGIVGATVAIGQYIVNDYIITIAEAEGDYGYTMTITKGTQTQTVTLYGLTPAQYDAMLGYLEQAQAAAQSAQSAAESAGESETAAREFERVAGISASSASSAKNAAQSAASNARSAASDAASAKNDAVTAKNAAEAAATRAETAAGQITGMTAEAETLEPGSSATASFLDGVLSLGIPAGANGANGNGIVSITKTATQGNVDTYTITYTNGTTSNFTVTNGVDGAVTSVAGKTGAVTLDAGDVSYDDQQTYDDGTVGAVLTNLKSQTNANTFDINILKSYHKSDLTYADISKIVKAGAAADWFEIGDQIVTTWSPDGTTNYDMPWDVVDIAPVVNADGDTVPGLWLESHWALPGLQFDASEALYYTAEGLPAGTYHFTIGTKWGTHCVAGTSYQFTLAEPVPAGGQICVANNTNFYTWGAPDVAPANWKIYTFSAFDITPIEGPVALVEGADGTDLGTTTTSIVYDTSTGINNLQRAAYGYNRDSQSAMLQWLNSDAEVSGWQIQKNPFDRPAQQYATIRGFMAGLPSDFLDIVNPVRVTTALNTVSDKNIGTSESYNARFFLASLEQEYIVPQLAGVEGVYWPYWKDRLGLNTPQITGSSGANVNHIRYGIENHATASYVRLRSVDRGYASIVWLVFASGSAYSTYATAATHPAPACVIC